MFDGDIMNGVGVDDKENMRKQPAFACHASIVAIQRQFEQYIISSTFQSCDDACRCLLNHGGLALRGASVGFTLVILKGVSIRYILELFARPESLPKIT